MDTEKLLECLLPLGPQSAFDPLQPKMSSLQVDDVVLAKACHLVVTNVMGPLVSKGMPAEATLTNFIDNLERNLPTTNNQMISAAFVDIRCACAALRALLDPGTSNAADKVEELTSSRKGPLFVLRQVISNVEHYKRKLQEVQKTAVATSSLSPLLASLADDVKEKKLEKVQEAIANLPDYRKALRAGAAAPLEDALCAFAKERCLEEDTMEEMEKAVSLALSIQNVLSDSWARALEPHIETARKNLLVRQQQQHQKMLTDVTETLCDFAEGDFEDEERCSSMWEQVRDLLMDKQSFSEGGGGQKAETQQQLVKEIKKRMAGLILHRPSMVEVIADGMDELAKLIGETSDVSETKYYRALAKLMCMKQNAEKHETVEELLAQDKKSLKPFLLSYRTCRTWKKDGIPEEVFKGLEENVAKVHAYLKTVATADMKQLKTSLLSETRKVEALVEKHAGWKKDLSGAAPWKSVVEVAEQSLLAEGVGASLQNGQKQFLKASWACASEFVLVRCPSCRHAEPC